MPRVGGECSKSGLLHPARLYPPGGNRFATRAIAIGLAYRRQRLAFASQPLLDSRGPAMELPQDPRARVTVLLTGIAIALALLVAWHLLIRFAL
jgi:hypothetical protein